MRTKPLGALPRFELGGEWRSSGDGDGEGEEMVLGKGDEDGEEYEGR